MNARRRKFSRLVALLGAGQIFLTPLHAQPATNLPVPAPKSPVDSFLELLALTPAERKQALADRPPETQKRILAKVREYLSLKPDERELRLRATELRWYLFPLLGAPGTNRTAKLAAIPTEQRKLVEDRLAQWDKLPPTTQIELLQNELTARYLTQLEGSGPEQRTKRLAGISPERRAQLEADRWPTLSEDQRRKTCERFDQFFELTPKEKEQALKTLSDAERRQMEKTLRAFEKLPRDRRATCIVSFEKFATMNVEERQRFLENAERWRLMSPAERQAWRDLVAKVPEWPPFPPPPLPPGLPVPVATNNN